MTHAEAAKLLGGYATGTLTEAERRTLFAMALEHQDLFDALMDEEALRELLADPAAKAQLLAALASAAPPKVVPFWRRTGVLGAAASLIVAATAGLAYLRSPEAVPPPVKQEEAKPAAVKPLAAPAEAHAPAAPARKTVPVAPLPQTMTPVQMTEATAPPPPAPVPQIVTTSAPGAPAAAVEDSARMRTQADLRRAEAQDNLAKKAEAPRSAVAAGMAVVGSVAPAPAAAKAKASGGVGRNAAVAPPMPAWTMVSQPDGSTQVTVTAPRGPQIVLLRRGGSGVEVLKLRTLEEDLGGTLARWRCQIRLAEGEALDLYLLNTPPADPAKLPESGPVDGFRARIYPLRN